MDTLVIMWGVVLIVGIFIVIWSSSGHITKWWIWVGLTLSLISIYSISTINKAVGDGLTLVATIIAAGIAAMSFDQTNRLEKRRATEAMLREIMDWAVDIQNAPWQAEFSPASTLESINVNEVFRYAAVFTRNDYMQKISEKAFDGKLKEDVRNLIKTLTIYVYLKRKNLGVTNTDGFGGTARSLIEAFEIEVSQEQKTTEQWLSEFGRILPASVNKLLIKIAEVRIVLIDTTNLLDSK